MCDYYGLMKSTWVVGSYVQVISGGGGLYVIYTGGQNGQGRGCVNHIAS